jgi:prophage regulatory protein
MSTYHREGRRATKVIEADQEFIGTEEFAALTRRPRRTVDTWVYKGVAPPHFKVGKRRLWKRAEVVAWIEAQRAASP